MKNLTLIFKPKSGSRDLSKPLTFVLISLLVGLFVEPSTATPTFDPLAAFHSTSKKKTRIRILRQPHRDRYEIIKDILSLLRVSNSRPTSASYRSATSIGAAAGLPHGLTTKYLRELVDQGLVRMQQDSRFFSYYKIAPKGIRFLVVFAELENNLRSVNSVTN